MRVGCRVTSLRNSRHRYPPPVLHTAGILVSLRSDATRVRGEYSLWNLKYSYGKLTTAAAVLCATLRPR